MARRLRPISRWISVARPSEPRRILVGVLPGSMAYSAVNQPIDFPSRNGGTVSDMLAVTSTAVSPDRYSTLPGLLRTNPRSIETGRSWSFFRWCDRVIGNLEPLLWKRRLWLNLVIAQEPYQE